ncbi:MAG: GNAT family N-acetyltransferase, partial [Okeania sp. SIO3B3]|nr:GNAT family N-acetyltransferase [Okeania sp. SIO3B3]
TVDRYLSTQTPIWWVEVIDKPVTSPIGCLWLGNAIDQVEGDQVTHIFLLYVSPPHRRLGIGSALVTHAENWAKARGDRQIGLQVFVSNQPALNLYHKLGFQSESMLMVKSLRI